MTTWLAAPPHRSTAIVAVVLLAATSIEGGTIHGSAFALRLLVAVGSVLLWPSGTVSIRSRDLVAPGVALSALLLGWLTTTNPGVAIQAWIRATLVICLYLAVVARPSSETRRLLHAAIAVAAVHSVWAVLERLLGLETRGNGGFFNPNDLAAFLAPLLLICMHGALRSKREQSRVAALRWTAVFVLAAGLLATNSRSGAIAALIGSCILMTPQLRRRPAVAITGLIAAVSMLLLGAQRWLGASDPFAYARLTHIWPRSIALALQRPFGVGLGDYADAMRVFGVPFDGWVRYPKQASSAHSEPLHAWVEMGWLGLIATTLPAILIFVTILRTHHAQRDLGRESANRETAANVGVLASFALPALASSSLHVPTVALLAALWAGRVVRADKTEGRLVTIGDRVPGRALVGAIVGITVALAIPGLVSSIATDRAARLRDQGRLQEAEPVAELAASAAPWSLGAGMLSESLGYLNGRKPLAAAERLIDLADRFPSSPKPLERAAWLLEREVVRLNLERDAWGPIVGLRREAIKRDPRNALAWHRLAVAQIQAGDPIGAEETLRRGLDVEPNCAKLLARTALLLDDRGGREEAVTLARRAFKSQRESATYPGGATILSLDENLAKMLQERRLITQ